MAKYENSPFGTIKGAQSGVVGARWKGINYIRQHVIPANPQTVSQTTQRNKMKNITEFGRRIVDTVINAFTIPLPKKQSAFNAFVGRNVKLQSTGTMDYTELVLTLGALYNPGFASCVADVSDEEVNIAYATDLQGEALATDLAKGVLYNVTQDKFYIGGSDTRGDGGISFATPDIDIADVIHGWLFFVAADGSIVSDSAYSICTVQA